MWHRQSPFLIGLVAALFATANSFGQADDKAREHDMRSTRLWQKKPLERKELDRCLVDCRSTKADVVKDAMYKLAMAYPDAKRTRDVIAAARPVKDRFPDKFYKKAYGEICSEWEGAEKAAQILSQAKKNGGMKYVEKVLQSPNPLTRHGAHEALRFSGQPQAGEILVRNYEIDILACKETLLEIGPAGASAVTKLLEVPAWQIRFDGLMILQEVATKDELPAIEKAQTSDSNRFIQDNAKRTAAAIEARLKKGKLD